MLVRLGLARGAAEQSAQRGPPGVDLVMVVLRVVREQGPTFGAQPGTVKPADRLERQTE